MQRPNRFYASDCRPQSWSAENRPLRSFSRKKSISRAKGQDASKLGAALLLISGNLAGAGR
jgi:hypothetical protein